MKPPVFASEICSIILDCETYEELIPIREYLKRYACDYCIVDLKFIRKLLDHRIEHLLKSK